MCGRVFNCDMQVTFHVRMYEWTPRKSNENPRVMGCLVWGLDRQPDPSAHGVGHPFGDQFKPKEGLAPLCQLIKNYLHHIPLSQV